MQFDNKQFEQNVQTSLHTLDNLKKGLDLSGAAKGLEEIDTNVKNHKFGILSDALHTVTDRFSALEVIGVTALVNITNSAVNAGKQLLNSLTVAPIKQGFDEYELKMGSVQTIMASTGASLEEVNGYLDELNEYADKTIYSFSDMTSNIGKFTNAGVGLKDAVSAIQGISNVAAVSGANAQQASHAMYNFAQALSSGSVRRQDWISIKTATMDTVEFKNALIETALELGTVTKQGDKFISTTSDANGHVSEAFDASCMFEDSLRAQWMTTDVLVKTLGKYSDENTELGKKAFAAAQDVKTFTQLLDTLKEAVGSGWATTWETIFGDFEEAKKLWTDVSNVVGGFIDAQSDARNELLKGWKDLGGRTALIEAFKNAFEGLKSVVTPVKQAIREIFPPLTAKQLFNFTEKLKELTSKFKLSEKSSENLKNTVKGLASVVALAKNAIGAVIRTIKPLFSFLTKGDSKILTVTGYLGEWLTRINDIIIKNDLLYKSIQVVIGYVKKGLAFIAEKLHFPQLDSLRGDFGSVFGYLGEKLEAFKENSINSLSSFADKISSAFNKKIDTSEIDKVNGKIEHTDSLLTKIKNGLQSFGEKVAQIFANIKNAIVQSKLGQFFIALFNAVSKIAKALFKLLGNVIGDLTDRLKKLDLDKLLNIIDSLTFAGIAVAIRKLVNSLSDGLSIIGNLKSSINGLTGIFGSVTGILDGVKDCLSAYQEQLKAGTLLRIAFAVGILAASIIALSFVDKEKLQNALSAITVLFAELTGSMALFTRMSGGMKDSAKVATVMISLSVSILILAAALKKVSSLNQDELGRGITGILVMTGTIVAACLILNRNKGKVLKGALNMILFAAAIKILASVCKTLAALNWDELIKGLVGVGVLLGESSIFLRFTKTNKKMFSAALSMVIIASAMKILASVYKTFAQMSWEEITKGLVSVGGLLLELSLFTSKLSKNKGILSSSLALIAIGTGMKILASACKTFAQMNWEEIAKGLVGVGGLMLELSFFTSRLSKNKGIMSSSIALIAIGASLKIFVSACKSFADMDWEQIAKGLVGVGSLIIEISFLASRLSKNKGIFASSLALIAVGAALKIMVSVCKTFGEMDWESIGKGLVGIGGLLLEIAAFSKLTSNSKRIFTTSLALIAMGAGMKIFASVCKSFASLSWEDIAKGLIAIAGSFAVIGIAARLLRSAIPSILGLGAGMLVVGIGIAAVGGGLTLLGIGLTSVTAGLTALVTSVTVGAAEIIAAVGAIILGIIKIAPSVIKELGSVIKAFCEVIIDSVPDIIKTIKTVLISICGMIIEILPTLLDTLFKAVISFLSSVKDYVPQIIDLVFDIIIEVLDGVAKRLPELIDSAVKVIFALIDGVLDAMTNTDTDIVGKIFEAVQKFSGILLALGGLGVLAAPALAGVIAMGGVVAELILLFTALAGIEQIPGLHWLIDEGAKLLSKIGEAIGSLIGGLVGSVMSEVSNVLPSIGENLSAFMTNAEPFIKGIGDFKASSLEGVRALADIVLLLTGAGILDGLTKWLTGGSSLAQFGEQLKDFGPELAAYYDSVKDIDENVVKISANAAECLAEMSKKLPKQGGLAQWFFGSNNLSAFAKELVAFGPSFKSYYNHVKGINASVVMITSYAAKTVAEVANKLPKHNGVVQWFKGDATLSTFAKELEDFGPAIKDYAEKVEGLDNLGAVKNSAAAIKMLADAEKALKNHGGIKTWVNGDASLSGFAKELEDMAPAIKGYAEKVEGLDNLGAVKNSAAAIKMLADAEKTLKNHGGIKTWVNGDASLSGFAKELEDMGPAIKGYAEKVEGLDNLGAVKNSAAAIKMLADAEKGLKNHGGMKSWVNGDASLSDFAKQLEDMAPAISSYASSVEGMKNIDAVDASAKAITLLAEAEQCLRNHGGFEQLITGDASLSSFAGQLKDMAPAIKDYADKVQGMKNIDAVDASAKAITLLADAEQCLRNHGGFKQSIEGDASLSDFAKQLYDMAPAIKQYADEIKDFKDTGAVDASAKAITILAKAEEGLRGHDGLKQWVEGDAKLSDFAKELPDVGDSIVKFTNAVAPLNDSTNAAQNASSAIEILATAESKLGNSGGFFEFFNGKKQTLAGFSQGFPVLGQAIYRYYMNVRNVDSDKVKNSAEAATVLSSIYQYLPTIGGIMGYIAGNKLSLEQFGAGIAVLGNGIGNYAKDVENIDTEKVTKSAEAISSLAGIYDSLPNIGGMAEWINGHKQSLEDFGNSLSGLAQGVRKFYAHSSTVDTDKLVSIVDATTKIVKMGEMLNDMDVTVFGSFGYHLEKMADSGIKRFSTAFANVQGDIEDLGKDIVKTLCKGIRMEYSGETNNLKSTILSLTATIKDELDSYDKTWIAQGEYIVDDISLGIEEKSSEIETVITVFVLQPIRSLYNKFKETGSYVAEGFVNGVKSKISAVSDVCTAIGQAVSSALGKSLKINSPSKVGYELGGFFGEGFVNALDDYRDISYDRSFEIGNSAKGGLNKSINAVRDYLTDNLDTSPTIRPVLDLSSLTNDVNDINGILNGGRTMQLARTSSFEMKAGTLTDKELRINDKSIIDQIVSLRSEVSALNQVISSMRVVMDTGALVGAITKPMDRALGRISVYDRRGN